MSHSALVSEASALTKTHIRVKKRHAGLGGKNAQRIHQHGRPAARDRHAARATGSRSRCDRDRPARATERRGALPARSPRATCAALEHGFAAVLTDYLAGALDGAAPDVEFYEEEEGT
jgi:hypothetical protein